MKNHKRLISLMLALVLTLALDNPVLAAVEDTGFSDVDASAWYAGAVQYCREHGLMNGTTATTFNPEGTLTRAQMVTVLYRAAGSPAVSETAPFPDTVPGAYYANAVAWASQRGLVGGYRDGRFGPNDPLTQRQFTLIFQRYTDAPVTAGISGFDGTSAPATRAQTAAALMALSQQSQVESSEVGVSDSLLLLPGGTFTMGSPDSERLRDADETAHQVTVSSFYIDPYEVTQADYERVMSENPSHFHGTDLPVDSVTWYDAIEYCNKLSESRGLTPVYTVNGQSVSWNRAANGYRLLTEAEWEYAARGGTTSEFYTGGFISAEEANYYGNYPYLIEENYVNHTNPNVVTGVYRNTTVQGNTLAPNGFQLYNMLGNVSEWVFDCYGEYDLTNAANPTGAESGHLRVNRGGAYNDFAKHLRCAYRSAANPVSSDQNLGFRIARNAAPGQGTVQAAYDLNITIPNNPKILVAYFSSSGNTENAAQIIQQKTGGDLFEIEMANPYTGALYQQSQQDLYAGTRPALRTHVDNMDQYDVILLGYPTWWATIPMPVVSFLEEYDFSGKTVINFSSHGGGRFGESVSLLSKEVPGAYVGFGFGFHYSGGSTLSDEISHWLEQNGISEIS